MVRLSVRFSESTDQSLDGRGVDALDGRLGHGSSVVSESLTKRHGLAPTVEPGRRIELLTYALRVRNRTGNDRQQLEAIERYRWSLALRGKQPETGRSRVVGQFVGQDRFHHATRRPDSVRCSASGSPCQGSSTYAHVELNGNCPVDPECLRRARLQRKGGRAGIAGRTS